MTEEERQEAGKFEAFADTLRGRIMRGEFGSRGRIPGISDLAREWKTTRATVYNAVALLQSEGLLVAKGSSLYVSFPKLELEGITENFERLLRSQGFEVTMENVIAPSIEPMPPDVAAMFGQSQGVRVVHRMRKQGIEGQDLRIAENWYPERLAGQFLEQMRVNEHMDVLGAIKEVHGIYITRAQDVVKARIPTAAETKMFNVGRTEPIVEIRRSNFAEDGTAVMWNKILHIAPFFQFTYRYPVTHWNK